MKAVHFRADLNTAQREEELKKLCISEQHENFFRTLTDSDVDKEKHLYAENGGDLRDARAEAKAAADIHKATISTLEKSMEERLERIETRKRKVYDKLYGVPNFANGLMEFFDRFGEMISSRKLTPDENTGQLFNNYGGAHPAAGSLKVLGNSDDAFDAPNNFEEDETILDADFEIIESTEPTGANEDAEDAAADKAADDKAGAGDKPKKPKAPRKTTKKTDAGQNTEDQ